MKSLAIFFSVFSFALVTLPARADHHEVFIHDVLLLDPSSCAVELWISADGQDAFAGSDRVEINDVLLASIGDMEAAEINAGGNTNTGDSILFASSGFEAETGLEADVPFSDASCALFIAGTTFSFVIDDPLFGGPNVVIDDVTVPGGFVVNFSAFRGSSVAAPSLLNLDDQTVIVANNDGDSIVVGTSPDGGGCTLGAAGFPPASWAFAGACSVLFALRAYKRKKAALQNENV